MQPPIDFLSQPLYSKTIHLTLDIPKLKVDENKKRKKKYWRREVEYSRQHIW